MWVQSRLKSLSCGCISDQKTWVSTVTSQLSNYIFYFIYYQGQRLQSKHVKWPPVECFSRIFFFNESINLCKSYFKNMTPFIYSFIYVSLFPNTNKHGFSSSLLLSSSPHSITLSVFSHSYIGRQTHTLMHKHLDLKPHARYRQDHTYCLMHKMFGML